jgi:hypothetical protein
MISWIAGSAGLWRRFRRVRRHIRAVGCITRVTPLSLVETEGRTHLNTKVVPPLLV